MTQNNDGYKGNMLLTDATRTVLLPLTAILGALTLIQVVRGRMTWAQYGRMWLRSLPFCD
jgi:hypothetical protein